VRRTRAVQAAGLLAAVALTAAACGGDDEGNGDGGASDVTVGIGLTDAGTGDFSFNDSAAAGAIRIEDDLGASTQILTPSKGQEQQNLETLINAGADPIVAIGFTYESALGTVAPANPDAQFAIVDSVVEGDNVTSLVFAEEQGSFLMGALAALRSETGNVGFIGAQQVPLLEKFAAGYKAGAEAAGEDLDKDITVQVQWIGTGNETFSSPDKAQVIAESMVDKGADVLYHAAGGSGNGMFNACAATGAVCIGVDSDQYESFAAQPDVQRTIITSMVKRVDNAVYAYAEGIVDGSITGGETVTGNLENEGVGYSTSNPDLTESDIEYMDGWQDQIIAGDVEVPTTLS